MKSSAALWIRFTYISGLAGTAARLFLNTDVESIALSAAEIRM
jgi:hypothetical protein